MPNQREKNPHDPWEPGEQIDFDIPEHAGDIEIENNPPSEAAADEFFSDPRKVGEIMEDFAAQQRAAALGKAAEEHAREIYAQQEEKEREESPHRARLSIEKLEDRS